jgi:ABC-type glycerol-3-phosphate transport system substrate-binding protein
MKNFQIIIIIIFIALAVLGVFVFSGAIPIGKSSTPGALGTVYMWGTVNSNTISPLLEEFNKANPTFVLNYVQKDADTFDQDLLEALAIGSGPDMILLPDNLAFHYANKISVIPYASYPVSTFKNTFAGAGEVFLTSKGILAIPMTIDPLVMYYNRSQLDADSVIYPPTFWDEIPSLVPVLTKKDNENKIIKSTVALGHFSNVAHAKDILSTLFMQKGSPIVTEREGSFVSALTSNNTSVNYNLDSALKFYTDFADPNKAVYSWNKSFSNSVDAFSSEDLAFYFGFSSELIDLIKRNPNENFLAAPMPQLRGTNFKLTGARVMGVAILSSSKNFSTAYTAANLLATSSFAYRLANMLGVAPARRDLLAIKPNDSFSPVFYNSALFAKSWLDPSPKDTDDIFRRMIDGILSNNADLGSAISNASSRLNLLLAK